MNLIEKVKRDLKKAEKTLHKPNLLPGASGYFAGKRDTLEWILEELEKPQAGGCDTPMKEGK